MSQSNFFSYCFLNFVPKFPTIVASRNKKRRLKVFHRFVAALTIWPHYHLLSKKICLHHHLMSLPCAVLVSFSLFILFVWFDGKKFLNKYLRSSQCYFISGCIVSQKFITLQKNSIFFVNIFPPMQRATLGKNTPRQKPTS